MDFSTSPKLEDLLNRAREFMEAEVYPLEATARQSFEEVLPAAHEARKRCKEAGLWAPQMPTEYGGMGLEFLPHCFRQSYFAPIIFASLEQSLG